MHAGRVELLEGSLRLNIDARSGMAESKPILSIQANSALESRLVSPEQADEPEALGG